MKENKDITYLFYIFLIGGFTGFIYEIIFYYLEYGYFIKSGILYGIITPIYGIGAIFLYYLKKYKNKPLLLFILSMLITGLVEYIIGYIAFNYLDLRLWNYDNALLNINGIICLRSITTFAIGSLLLHYLIIPLLDKIFINIKYLYLKNFAYLSLFLFTTDVILSIIFKKPKTF